MRDFATVNNALSEMAQRNSIANLRLGAEATVGLCLADGVEVDFEYDGERNRLYIYSTIAPLPKDERERLKMCEAMLELNCLEKELACGALSIHRQREAAICQLGLPAAGLSSTLLEKSLRELLSFRRSMANALACQVSADDDAKSAARRHSTMSLLAKRAQER